MKRMIAGTLLALGCGLWPAAGAAQQSPNAQPARPDSQVANAAAPVARPAPVSWVSDRRMFHVGDVISVLVDEYTLATADKTNVAQQDRSRKTSAGAGYNGTSMGDGNFQTSNSGQSTDRGQSSRHNRITGEITVRVVEVTPDGTLRIEGEKAIQVDKHVQKLRLTGLLRPEDVPPTNVVESWRIADSQIQYTSKGDLSKPRGGIISRLLGWLWP